MVTRLLGKCLTLNCKNTTDDVRSSLDIPEQRILVNFDVEKNRTPHPDGPDTCYCVIKKTKSIRLGMINAYIKGDMPFDNTVLESISMFNLSIP